MSHRFLDILGPSAQYAPRRTRFSRSPNLMPAGPRWMRKAGATTTGAASGVPGPESGRGSRWTVLAEQRNVSRCGGTGRSSGCGSGDRSPHVVGRDAELAAVLGYRAAGDVDAVGGKSTGEGVVAERVLLGGDEPTEKLVRPTGGLEELPERDDLAARKLGTLVGRRPADRRLVEAEVVGDLRKRQRP